MSIIASPMLDFSTLKAPSEDGQVLVEPEPLAWVEAAKGNGERLRDCDVPVLGRSLSAWRRETRCAIAGSDERTIVVLGHQPELFHPGVWAKRAAAARFAESVDGLAINLIVDNDAPRRVALAVPVESHGRLRVRSIPFTAVSSGQTYEQLVPLDEARINEFKRQARDAMGDRFHGSLLPIFLKALRRGPRGADGVEQIAGACRTAESVLGVRLEEHRVSTVWASPLLLDMVLNAERFVDVYNDALAHYRRANRVRGRQRPIPDLKTERGRFELPAWAYRDREPRARLFVEPSATGVRLLADRREVGFVSREAGAAQTLEDVASVLGAFPGWHLRPRALTLTTWARLLLADLFVHGIGGAKYDRISDQIMRAYYSVSPPQMACVSATLHLGLPYHADAESVVYSVRRAIRDLRYNPQRGLSPGEDADRLVSERASAVRRSAELRLYDARNHRERREAFERIRALNEALLEIRREDLNTLRAHLTEAELAMEDARVARRRDCFFGLYPKEKLHTLLEALPGRRDFGV